MANSKSSNYFQWQYKFNSFKKVAIDRLDKEYPELNKLLDKALKSGNETTLTQLEKKFYYKICSDLCILLINLKEKHNKKYETDFFSIISRTKKEQLKIEKNPSLDKFETILDTLQELQEEALSAINLAKDKRKRKLKDRIIDWIIGFILGGIIAGIIVWLILPKC